MHPSILNLFRDRNSILELASTACIASCPTDAISVEGET